VSSDERRRGFFDDPEVLDLLRDQPELLAIADAIAETQVAGRKHRTRPALLVAAALLLAVVITGTLAFWPAGNNGIVERALAAVSGGAVLHARFEQVKTDEVVVNLSNGIETPTRIEVQTWFDERQGQLRSRVRRNGVLVADVVQPATAASNSANVDRSIIEFTGGYRAALEAGRARLLSRGAGGPMLLIDIAPLGAETVTLNPHTAKPIEVALTSSAWRVREIAAQPRHEQDFIPASTPRAPVRGEVRASRRVRPSTVTAAQVAWPGRAFAGFRLLRAYEDRLSATFADGVRRDASGFRIVYQRDNDPHSKLVVQMAKLPEPAYGFVEGRLTVSFNPIPPNDALALVHLGRRPRGDWVGQFRHENAFITIRGQHKSSVLAAARAVR
jgi:hypothetical protein